jgi:hypothetical protein
VKCADADKLMTLGRQKLKGLCNLTDLGYRLESRTLCCSIASRGPRTGRRVHGGSTKEVQPLSAVSCMVVRILDSNPAGITSTSGYTVELKPCLSELAAAARKWD